ncbi:MAG: hypothetical protein K1X78_25765 [Verrucomicrobiaceae bacterium]|nr:hypothetical protein [Verrucomicrobiaceae bacterium]
MNSGYFVTASFTAPVVATWSMRPPLVPVDVLIGVVFASCVLLFWVRSSVELKQAMFDRLYGPGVRPVRLDWWEADLDAALIRMAKRWSRKRAANRRGNPASTSSS